MRPSVHYIEALSEKQLRVEWSAGANDRVKQEKTIEGKLIFEGETPSPSALPTVEPTATPVPESCTVTFVYPAELGYSEAESRVTVTVPFGGSATPPTPDKAHQKEHYTLTWPAGWENVTADVTIEGVLTPKTYTVRCRVLDAQGKELYAQDHAHVYGTALTLPSFDLPDGQKVEWDNLPDQITGDCEIIGHVASFLNGQVPLICGTGRYDTLNTIKMSKYAQDCGADGVMVILPYYLNPHKKAVMQHFRDIRAALDIRMMIYNNPWFLPL